ncbi:RNA polymerase-associated protein CTR9 homolog isoform X2 [Sipha flava]|uniref:RNA polymerase-associated protein CTR9 homolog isoform X2 n=1 Tax=Sipha flava TaxID=143950 RepID=A0A8B8FPD0_9HEMI|nr:RNA polymerase-associated protein CTR9 homolog isoform X2 [Sipha flava]XP_025412563.1 RNA polymerase-associated protein CTR9 homolog isoform X2 [Sipha flava]
MECYKHLRGNDYSMIEIDDMYCSNGDLKLTNREENLIRGTDMLAAHLMEKAIREKSKCERQKLFEDIEFLYLNANKIVMNHMNHLLGRAFVCLLDNETMSAADLKLSKMLSDGLDCIPFTFGKSIDEIDVSRCKNNLIKQWKLLRENKEKSEYIRTDMSYNFLQLGEIEKARLGFELALKLNSNCVLALVGLSITLLIKSSKSPHTINLFVKFSNQLTIKTIKIETLFKIAFDYFKQGRSNKAIRYYNIILQRSRNLFRITKCLDFLGQAYELKGDYNRSFEYYYRAVIMNPNDIGYSYYGLAKMYIIICSFQKAEKCLETYLRVNPKCNKSKVKLSLLYVHSNVEDKIYKAQTYLKEVVNEVPNCLDAWVGLGLIAIINKKELNNIYHNVVVLTHGYQLTRFSVDLIIDMALIYFKFGEYDYSCSVLELAVKFLKQLSGVTPCLYYIHLTNVACGRLVNVYLELKEFQKADKLLKEMMQKNPKDVEPIIVLAKLFQVRHQDNEAREYAKKALQFNPRCPEALKILRKLNLEDEMDLSEFNESSLKNLKDIFINLKDMAIGSTKNITVFNKDTEFDNLALEFFGKLLNSDPVRIWGPDMLGQHLANGDILSKLKNTFSIAEKSNILCSTWIYYAKDCEKKKLYNRSIKIMKVCLKLFFLHDTFKIYPLIGYQYILAYNFQDAYKMFLKAFMAIPGDFSIINCMAFTIQQIGNLILEKKKCTMRDVHKAMENIKLAEKYFTFLVRQNDVMIHGVANEGLVLCQLKINLLPIYKRRVRLMEIKLMESNS